MLIQSSANCDIAECFKCVIQGRCRLLGLNKPEVTNRHKTKVEIFKSKYKNKL